MTEAEAEERIKQEWESGWEALHPADPEDPDHVFYTFDDEAGDSRASWVRVTINPTARERMTQGRAHAKYWHRGVIMVQVFGPPNSGGAAVAALCDDVRTVLEDKSFGVIDTHEGSTRKSASGDPRWAMRVVTVPFVVEVQS